MRANIISKSHNRRSEITSRLPDWISKGLKTSSIKEVPVSLFYQDSPPQKIHAIEFYQSTVSNSRYPLTAVDIIANSYLRLSYIKSNGNSATLGTSLVGSISFRTNDNILHFVPEISEATLEIDQNQNPQVTIRGRFGDLATLTASRRYVLSSDLDPYCQIKVTLEALKDIELASHALKTDAFRFCTLSSMYTPTHYDANSIEYVDHQNEVQKLLLNGTTKRNSYLFTRSPKLSTKLALIKDGKSAGRVCTPGSSDSPSMQLSIDNSEFTLAAQAYLDQNLDVNADSLSLWLEWIDAPNIISCGRKISLTYTVRALKPEFIEKI